MNCRKLLVVLLISLAVALALLAVVSGFLLFALALGDTAMVLVLGWISGAVSGAVAMTVALLAVVLAIDRIRQSD